MAVLLSGVRRVCRPEASGLRTLDRWVGRRLALSSLGVADAMAEIWIRRGRQFDPTLVDGFLNLVASGPRRA
jgi:hypothetical protein